ncbi:MAG: serine/threonine protein kinase [Planctomycetes bacterium]|nr:serine/threonine protein kinase [Planctomycetota bacterium]
MKICLSCEGVTNTAAQRCGHCGAFLLPADSVHFPDRRGEADSGNPLLGSVIDGKYRLQTVLGRGGLGTVFQAVHIGSLMPVAVKLLHPRFSERPEYRRALLPEARRAATIANERCARLLDVGEAEDGVAYLAMELVSGETLDVLVRRGALLPSHALLVLTQIAQALVAIHAAGLVHCDLSPRNVMVSVQDGVVRTKVLDFGIARSAAIAGAERVRAGEFAGFVNPAFAAPEQHAAQEVDGRADLYSFGTLAWLLLSGQMPVDDGEPRRAARAVVAGELRPWPNVPGVPRRLQRLVLSCLRLDRAERPASAQAVLDELLAIAAVRRPVFARAAVAALLVSAMAWFMIAADNKSQVPFLRLVPGSSLELAERMPASEAVAQDLSSRRLGTLVGHFGGFLPSRLCVDVSRGGRLLRRVPLQPEVDAAGDTFTLSTAQPQWKGVVESLLEISREEAVDLSFVVPGAAPLGSARVRLDDEPPHLECSLQLAEPPSILANTKFVWRAEDAIGLQTVVVVVTWANGRQHQITLPGASGELDLGRELAAVAGGTEDQGPGEITCRAKDRAGNSKDAAPIPFQVCDTAAPEVLEVTGPAGEAFVPTLADRARFRVRLSAPEANCTLHVLAADGRDLITVPLAGTGLWRTLDVPFASGGGLVSGALGFAVVDGAGNRVERQFVVTLRDRSLRLQFAPDGTRLASLPGTLVVAEDGARAILQTAATWRVSRASLQLAPGAVLQGGTSNDRVQVENLEPGRARFLFAALPAGVYRLEIVLDEAEGDAGHRVTQELNLRVLPAALEVRLPQARSRFLSGVLQAGVLSQRSTGLRDGPGWRVDPDLRPFLDGTLWVGADRLVPVPLPARAIGEASLLPEILPVPGHNVLAVELRDVLDRPARVLVGDGETSLRDYQGHRLAVIADFWWHTAAPEPIGEELLVEYGQPVRIKMRMPLPYLPAEREELRLGLAQSELPASSVVADGDAGAVVTYDVPFVMWSVAAKLADRPREAYATQLEARMTAYVDTPVGRYTLELRLRTMRSTLRVFHLGELSPLPDPLAQLCLVPVLAPDGPFAEPVPIDAPSRALFRPQDAVSVRNFSDFLLQDREFTCGEARALLNASPAARQRWPGRRLVHEDDPLGEQRLLPGELLPAAALAAPDQAPLCGVNFFQAYSLCRLLGLVVAGDPDLFRLPLGCELELAAFGAVPPRACNGPAAVGKSVSILAFVAAEQAWQNGVAPTAADCLAARDAVATAFGVPILGLDFGVREWVGDLPHAAEAELLLSEWIGDYEVHLAKTAAFASGAMVPPRDLAAALRSFGVVRGLALGEMEGLISKAGTRLQAERLAEVPASVPGVLRTEQLRRDGRALLSRDLDPRLQRTGFRVAGQRELLKVLRGKG